MKHETSMNEVLGHSPIHGHLPNRLDSTLYSLLKTLCRLAMKIIFREHVCNYIPIYSAMLLVFYFLAIPKKSKLQLLLFSLGNICTAPKSTGAKLVVFQINKKGALPH